MEFRLAGLVPDKWEIADSLSLMYYLGYEKTCQILPLNINLDAPADKGTLFYCPESEKELDRLEKFC